MEEQRKVGALEKQKYERNIERLLRRQQEEKDEMIANHAHELTCIDEKVMVLRLGLANILLCGVPVV